MGNARISSSYLRILHKIDMGTIEGAIQQVKIASQNSALNDDTLGPLIRLKAKKLVEIHIKLKKNKSNKKNDGNL